LKYKTHEASIKRSSLYRPTVSEIYEVGVASQVNQIWELL